MLDLGDVVALADGARRVVSRVDRFTDTVTLCLPWELPRGRGDLEVRAADVTMLGEKADLTGLHIASADSGIEGLITTAERDLLVRHGASDRSGGATRRGST